jgi:hypothetical protein
MMHSPDPSSARLAGSGTGVIGDVGVMSASGESKASANVSCTLPESTNDPGLPRLAQIGLAGREIINSGFHLQFASLNRIVYDG